MNNNFMEKMAAAAAAALGVKTGQLARPTGYERGTEYAGGFDARQVFVAPDGREVEIFYSAVDGAITVVVE